MMFNMLVGSQGLYSREYRSNKNLSIDPIKLLSTVYIAFNLYIIFITYLNNNTPL